MRTHASWTPSLHARRGLICPRRLRPVAPTRSHELLRPAHYRFGQNNGLPALRLG
ncbi:MAG: hypothetical protein RMK79_13320 [Anaerolineae bacterium]|nr:hypothetical protein [Anaerolineae bacterium]